MWVAVLGNVCSARDHGILTAHLHTYFAHLSDLTRDLRLLGTHLLSAERCYLRAMRPPQNQDQIIFNSPTITTKHRIYHNEMWW